MSSLNPNSVFLVWKQMAKTLFVVKGIMYESEPFLNRQIWINSGSDLRHGMSPGMWSTAGTFINKIHTLKPSESEKLIFILANHDFFFFFAIEYMPGDQDVWENSVCESEFACFSILAEECLLILFSRPHWVSKKLFEEITKSWLAVNLISLYIIFWYLQQCKV